MIFELFSVLLGVFKLFVYKTLYFKRVSFKGIPKPNKSFLFAIEKGSKLNIKKGFRARDYISIRINENSIVDIGAGCFFNNGCSINAKKKITIGDHVIFGPGVQIFDHDHDFRSDDVVENFVSEEIKIGNDVWIGASSIILKGSKIGDGCVIAAGTIVKGEIPAGSLVYDKRDRQIIEIKK